MNANIRNLGAIYMYTRLLPNIGEGNASHIAIAPRND